MRQAGIIAAAGLEAVVNNYVRLSEVRCDSFSSSQFLSPAVLAATHFLPVQMMKRVCGVHLVSGSWSFEKRYPHAHAQQQLLT